MKERKASDETEKARERLLGLVASAGDRRDWMQCNTFGHSGGQRFGSVGCGGNITEQRSKLRWRVSTWRRGVCNEKVGAINGQAPLFSV